MAPDRGADSVNGTGMNVRLSLRHRLTLVLIAASACGLSLTGAGLLAHDARTARAHLARDLEGVARLVATNSDAALTFGDNLLMGSDDPTTDDFGPVQGMMVTYSAGDVDEATRVFDALADDGKITSPLAPTFFSPAFGMCVDRFGTPWMVDTEGAPPS